jgi:hypothetical protein
MKTHLTLLTLIVGLAIMIVAAGIGMHRSSRKKKKSSVGGFAWALLFLSGGRMPPPPPQSQIEQEAEARKNRQIGRGDES